MDGNRPGHDLPYRYEKWLSRFCLPKYMEYQTTIWLKIWGEGLGQP